MRSARLRASNADFSQKVRNQRVHQVWPTPHGQILSERGACPRHSLITNQKQSGTCPTEIYGLTLTAIQSQIAGAINLRRTLPKIELTSEQKEGYEEYIHRDSACCCGLRLRNARRHGCAAGNANHAFNGNSFRWAALQCQRE